MDEVAVAVVEAYEIGHAAGGVQRNRARALRPAFVLHALYQYAAHARALVIAQHAEAAQVGHRAPGAGQYLVAHAADYPAVQHAYQHVL